MRPPRGRRSRWQLLNGNGQRWWLMVAGAASQVVVVVERRTLVRGPATANWRDQGRLYRLNRAVARGVSRRYQCVG
jgi:hypothetical protein